MREIKSKISRDLAQFLIKRFLKPDIVEKSKGDFKFWGRETKLIGNLFTLYPNQEFWIILNLTFFLNSFAYFLTGDGKNELEKQWRLFCINKQIDSKKIDDKINFDILELNTKENVEVKKSNVLDWIDS